MIVYLGPSVVSLLAAWAFSWRSSRSPRVTRRDFYRAGASLLLRVGIVTGVVAVAALVVFALAFRW
jgi:hypothetical protein